MKRIHIDENKITLLKENFNSELTDFILNKVLNKQTALSHCNVFPKGDGMSYDYSLLKKRFNEVKEKLMQFEDIESFDEEYLTSYLSELVVRCQELEKPIEAKLIKLCENIVIELFSIPSETINLSCKLVNKIQYDNLPLLPEDGGDYEYDFSKMLAFDENIKDYVMKRRFINSLIQGASYSLGTIFEMYDIENEELIELYKRIIAINDFILFTVKEKINDKNPKQGAYVKVMLGREGEKSDIESQGLIFPLLLIETIRGFMELFASHGLPKNNDEARDIISHADFLVAEPWDLRYGVSLWEKIANNVPSKILPYFFSYISIMHNDEFNSSIRKMLEGGEEGEIIKQELLNKAERNFEYNNFVDVMKAKNDNYNVLTDDITNPDDLDKITLDEDYRQLSLPFDGNILKYNYEYFIDYLEKIGKYGTLPPNKFFSKHPLDIDSYVSWEYALLETISEIDNSQEFNKYIKDIISTYIDEDVNKQYYALEMKNELLNDSDVYDIICGYDYTDEEDKEMALQELKEYVSKHYSQEYLELAIELLNEAIENNGEVDEISFNEIQDAYDVNCFCQDIIDKCDKNEATKTIYNAIIDNSDDIGISIYQFDKKLGKMISSNFKQNILPQIIKDENGLIYIERGLDIENLFKKPYELKLSSYKMSMNDFSDGIGNCWSWCKGYGIPYNTSNLGTKIVLVGKIDPSNVNWAATVGLEYVYDNERELRIMPNSIIEIDEIYIKGLNKRLPLKQPILINSGHRWGNSY